MRIDQSASIPCSRSIAHHRLIRTKKGIELAFRCKHEVRPSKQNSFYVVIVLGRLCPWTLWYPERKAEKVALILFSIKAGSTTAGPNHTTRMIVLGKIFLYQKKKLDAYTRSFFASLYRGREKEAYIKIINNLYFYHNTDHAVYRLDVCLSYLLCTIYRAVISGGQDTKPQHGLALRWKLDVCLCEYLSSYL